MDAVEERDEDDGEENPESQETLDMDGDRDEVEETLEALDGGGPAMQSLRRLPAEEVLKEVV